MQKITHIFKVLRKQHSIILVNPVVVSNGKVQDKAGFGLQVLVLIYLFHSSHTYHK